MEDKGGFLFLVALQVFLISLSYADIATKNNQLNLLAERLRNYWTCMEGLPDASSVEHCPLSFDGWFCWPETTIGETATLNCPATGKPAGIARRNCYANGTWGKTHVEPVDDEDACGMDALQENQENHPLMMTEELSQLDGQTFTNFKSAAAFDECVSEVLSAASSNSMDGRYCRRTFDGWGCWNDTLPGRIAFIRCPTFIPGFLATKYAYRKCNDDGTWFRHPDTNRTWSNYTTCVDTEDLQFRQFVNSLYIVGYSISVVTLTISITVFCYFKSLNCNRITIHKNLFVSFIINNVLWIVWYSEVVMKPHVTFNNLIVCQILHIFMHYFLVTNYMWMFCEGLYLHTLMVIAFVKEERILRWFYFIGWGFPALLTVVYGTARGLTNDNTAYCWIEDSEFMWILSGPVILSLLVNFIFLINIVRVLVTKLRAPNATEAHQTRKAVRATFILIPLLGLHYVVTPFRPEKQSAAEAVYEITAAVVTSFQGLCVSLLFCFFNGEVISLIRKKFNFHQRGRERNKHYYATTTADFARKSIQLLISVLCTAGIEI